MNPCIQTHKYICKLLYAEIAIKHGRIAETVLQTADDIDADLIVMGTHSHTALGEFILGSVADKVMRMSRRPVLLVPTVDKAANS